MAGWQNCKAGPVRTAWEEELKQQVGQYKMPDAQNKRHTCLTDIPIGRHTIILTKNRLTGSLNVSSKVKLKSNIYLIDT